MSTAQSHARTRGYILVCAAAALIIPWSLVRAGRGIEERRAADPQGEVEIITVTGKVEIDGWDRNEVEVTGTAGDDVERVDVSSTGNRTSIHVVGHSVHGWGSDAGPQLVVHVPAKSAVTASLVSADVKVNGVLGALSLRTVSGNVSGAVGGDLRANTVSGDVKLTATAAKLIEVRTISGDIRLTGGGGQVDVTTVSGTAILEFAEVTRARFKSISGDISTSLALAPDGQIEGESVSGGLRFQFASAPTAEFDVQAFSGDIKNCFGPKPVESQYGSGSRLQFKNGEGGHGSVRVNTKSGDVQLCVKGMSNKRVASLSLTRTTGGLRFWPYVL
jgi:DUF4097 and DUF4098 domain-containing protein YvlB